MVGASRERRGSDSWRSDHLVSRSLRAAGRQSVGFLSRGAYVAPIGWYRLQRDRAGEGCLTSTSMVAVTCASGSRPCP
jgi:hypothetical protein